jgi:dihydrofolate synthase / folylpolyglutamate synthase
MNYQAVTRYLYGRLPSYERGDGVKAIKPGLTNIRLLTDALGQPHTKFPSIHVGGTNGKGSSSHMLAAVYQAAGYKVGLYTSPHLKSFTERIRINGQPIPEQAVQEFVIAQQSLIESSGSSFFEVTVAMAFDYFARMQVDLAVIEVGLGGRLDSTNIITPILSLITNIGFDHQEILGNTLVEIAAEKAGIIKPGVPVVISEFQQELAWLWEQKARESQARLVYGSGQVDSAGFYSPLIRDDRSVSALKGVNINMIRLDLLGYYQRKNLAGVLTCIDLLSDSFPVGERALTQGLANVVKTTGLKGRWQTLAQNPLTIVDVAHNLSGLLTALDTLSKESYNQLRVVFGVVSDKDMKPMMAILPKNAIYYFCGFSSPRAKPVNELSTEAGMFGLFGRSFSSADLAISAARNESAFSDLVLVIGSTYLVSDISSL